MSYQGCFLTKYYDHANESKFVSDAKQQTFLLKYIRGERTIKLF